MKRIRICADTSVFGGCFDPEFERPSCKFFEEVREGRFVLVTSDLTGLELDSAPENVQQILAEVPRDRRELVGASQESELLKKAYLEAGILGRSSANDAGHIALATIADVDILLRWNFKHIVHFEKIAGYQAVNMLHGYGCPKIFSPREVVELA